jgi:hypothetical protein
LTSSGRQPGGGGHRPDGLVLLPRLGPRAVATGRLMAFLLMCIGAQIVASGVESLATQFLTRA